MKSLESTLQAVVEAPEEHDNDDQILGVPTRGRKDSGYAEDPRRPIYRATSDFTGINPWQLQVSLIQVANAAAQSTSKSGPRREQFFDHRLAARYDSGQTVKREPRSKTMDLSSLLTPESKSQASSPHPKSKTLNYCSSSSSPITASASSVTYQKAQEIVHAVEVCDIPPSSGETTKPSSCRTSEGPLSRTPSRDSSTLHEMMHFDSYEEMQSSPLYAATNIDWTDPATRQKLYKKHDRSNRGLRRWLRKLTPKRWQDERLDFYDGNSDAGSVRRYRLDI